MLEVDEELGGVAAQKLVASIYDDLAKADPHRRTTDAIASAVAVLLAFEATVDEPAEFSAVVNAELEKHGAPWRIATAG